MSPQRSGEADIILSWVIEYSRPLTPKLQFLIRPHLTNIWFKSTQKISPLCTICRNLLIWPRIRYWSYTLAYKNFGLQTPGQCRKNTNKLSFFCGCWICTQNVRNLDFPYLSTAVCPFSYAWVGLPLKIRWNPFEYPRCCLLSISWIDRSFLSPRLDHFITEQNLCGDFRHMWKHHKLWWFKMWRKSPEVVVKIT